MTMGNEVYKVAPQNGGARFLFECFNNYYAYSPIFGPQFWGCNGEIQWECESDITQSQT